MLHSSRIGSRPCLIVWQAVEPQANQKATKSTYPQTTYSTNSKSKPQDFRGENRIGDIANTLNKLNTEQLDEHCASRKLAYAAEGAGKLFSVSNSHVYRFLDRKEHESIQGGRSRRITHPQMQDFFVCLEESNKKSSNRYSDRSFDSSW